MSPVPARATLVELPSRANSTVRKPTNPAVAVHPILLPSPVHHKVSQPFQPTIKKEKTKSRVWGMLCIKSKKSRDMMADPESTEGRAYDVSHKGDTLTPSRRKSIVI